MSPARQRVKTIWDFCRNDLGLRVELSDWTFGYSAAAFSTDGTERLLLARIWDPSCYPAAFVMLNPSTADASVDDNTIKRCMSFARRWGCGGLVVVNLFALRVTDPKVMLADPEPVGEHNDDVIAAVAESHPDALWVAGWGGNGSHRGRDVQVRRLLAERGVRLHYLRLTKQGYPWHPLYVRSNTELKAFEEGKDEQ